MSIKPTTCSNCDYIKQTQEQHCKFPKERGTKMGICSGRVPYKWIYQETVEWVISNYKTLR